MLQQLQNLASDDITCKRPPRSRVQFLNFVNKIFLISRLITKFTKILGHGNCVSAAACLKVWLQCHFHDFLVNRTLVRIYLITC